MNRRNISTVLMGAVVASASPATQTALPASTPGSQYPEYPQSPEELAAGITPSNYNYPPLNVLRYGAVGDGKTDDAAAFNRLFAVAKVVGGTCVIPAPSSHYLVTQPLDCALTGRGGNAGFNVQMQANPHFSANSPRGSIFAKHRQSAVFDCTGNNAVQFYDLCVSTDTSVYPATCFLSARATAPAHPSCSASTTVAYSGIFPLRSTTTMEARTISSSGVISQTTVPTRPASRVPRRRKSASGP